MGSPEMTEFKCNLPVDVVAKWEVAVSPEAIKPTVDLIPCEKITFSDEVPFYRCDVDGDQQLDIFIGSSSRRWKDNQIMLTLEEAWRSPPTRESVFIKRAKFREVTKRCQEIQRGLSFGGGFVVGAAMAIATYQAKSPLKWLTPIGIVIAIGSFGLGVTKNIIAGRDYNAFINRESADKKADANSTTAE